MIDELKQFSQLYCSHSPTAACIAIIMDNKIQFNPKNKARFMRSPTSVNLSVSVATMFSTYSSGIVYVTHIVWLPTNLPDPLPVSSSRRRFGGPPVTTVVSSQHWNASMTFGTISVLTESVRLSMGGGIGLIMNDPHSPEQ